MRTLEHPGVVNAVPVDWVVGGIHPIKTTLPPGLSLLDGLNRIVQRYGASSAVAQLAGGAFDPFAYVMPHTSSRPEYAVYFSDRHETEDGVALDDACVTVGTRNGEPWLHCHAHWRLHDGRPGCGHILPQDAIVSEAIDAEVWLLRDMEFRVGPDAETNFSLFQPISRSGGISNPINRAVAVRVAPNQDICVALESTVRELDMHEATIRGGVGSLVGASFDDGRRVEPFITEVYIQRGEVRRDADGAPRASLDVRMVDHTGQISAGRLKRGENAVLVTFELVLEPM